MTQLLFNKLWNQNYICLTFYVNIKKNCDKFLFDSSFSTSDLIFSDKICLNNSYETFIFYCGWVFLTSSKDAQRMSKHIWMRNLIKNIQELEKYKKT